MSLGQFGFRNRQPGDQLVSRWMQQGFIRSLQYVAVVIGPGALGAGATISAVNMQHTILLHNGVTHTYVGNPPDDVAIVQLETSTSVSAFRTFSNETSTIYGIVVEFHPGIIRSIQRGLITYSATVSQSVAIMPVNVARTVLIDGGQYSNSAGGAAYMRAALQLSSSTSVTSARAAPGVFGTISHFYTAVEFV